MAYWCDDRALDMEQRRLDAQQADSLKRMEGAKGMTEPNRYSVEKQADGTYAVFNNGGFVKGGWTQHEHHMALSYARDLASEDEQAGVPAAPEVAIATGRYHYIVRGHWPFPTDMLRHDTAAAYSAEQQAEIDRMSTEHAEDRSAFTDTEIQLVGDNLPNVKRWNSFGWIVVEIMDKRGKSVEVWPPEAEQTGKKQVGTIDITPSWAHVIEVCIVALEDGTEKGKAAAKEQLRLLGKLLDDSKWGNN